MNCTSATAVKAIFSLLIAILLAVPCAAKEVLLFRGGQPVPDYNRLVETIEVGDHVVFSGEREFSVKEILNRAGSNGLSFVFETDGGQLVRMAARRMNSQIQQPHMPTDILSRGWSTINPFNIFGARDHQTDPSLRYLMNYRSGMKQLANAGVAVVRIDFAASTEGEYVVTEKINIVAKLSEVFESPWAYESQLEVMKEKFLEFAATTASFEEIGEFATGNLVWNGERWILFHVGGSNIKWEPNVKSRAKKTVFDVIPESTVVIPKWIEDAEDRIKETRDQLNRGICRGILEAVISGSPAQNSSNPY